MRFTSTDLPKLLLGSLIENGLTAYKARIICRRLMGESNGDIANALGLTKQTVASEAYKHKADMAAFSHLCHGCVNAPVCEDYLTVPAISATVCDNFDPMEEPE